MKILLLGEYSNLHCTLADGLKQLGHQVTVASDGDGFKNYPRDIDLKRNSSSIADTVGAIFKVLKNLKNFKNYDIVQIINPCFTTLSVNLNRRLFYYLRKHNKKVFLGAFGDDSFWLRACLNNTTFRYSEFFENGVRHNMDSNTRLQSMWLDSDRDDLNTEIATNCDGIIACLPEYYLAYTSDFKEKLSYIPLPINVGSINKTDFELSGKIRFFIGINKDRSEFKGTDRLYDSLLKLQANYPDDVEIEAVHSVPYQEYVELMSKSHIVLDQLYSYSPAMNGLLAMAQGKILVGGGEPEVYQVLHEDKNKPIVNVLPDNNDIYNNLETLIQNRGSLKNIAENSRIFVEDHHDHLKVAQKYLDFWTKTN